MRTANVDTLAQNRFNGDYGHMMMRNQEQDDRESEIQRRVNAAYDKLSESDYFAIETKFIDAFGLENINPDNTEKALKYLLELEIAHQVDDETKEFKRYGEY